MRIPFITLSVLLLAQTFALAAQKEAAVDPAWDGMTFRIEDSRCFVGIAPVYLSVSELKPQDGKLVGTYTIEVPLMTSKNDHGLIVLPLNMTVKELGAKGGVLRGEAISKKKESPANLIVCEIIPKKDQAIKLAITTDDRTIKFKSRYTVIEASVTKRDA
jgi:hypothetical protein